MRLKLGILDIDFCQISGLGLILSLLHKVQLHSDHIRNLASENDLRILQLFSASFQKVVWIYVLTNNLKYSI